ncbi:MAG: LamG domain-containing protein [Phycisphaerae bacterium]|nr:LamG domain-containing protein [Phycisphaerae bacterium]
MCKKLFLLICFALMLGMASDASAELVGYWKFDEGSGTVAADSSAHGNDGTLSGNVTWVDGQVGGALDFDGSGSFVEIPHDSSLSITDEITVAAWTYMRAGASGEMAIVSKGGWAANDLPYELTETAGSDIFWQFYDDGGRDTCSPLSPAVDEWHHIAGTYDGTIFKCYIDGVLADEWAYAGKMPQNTASVTLGRRSRGGTFFNGIIDEVMIYDHALAEDEIPNIMEGVGDFGSARGPDPADGAFHEDTWITLSWRAGDFAVSHDVYLGENFDDVNDGTPGAPGFRGNQAATMFIAGFPGYPYPDGMVPGTTYYWRIDEVNETDPNSPWKGDTWSFSIPPKTAYFPDPIDGAESVDLDAQLSWTPGFGAKLHTVYLGDNFEDVNNATAGSPRGAATYTPPSPLEPEKVYYWRVDEFDPPFTHKGDVWGFTTPGAVGNPQPANGAVDVQMIETLSWTAADNATSHELYFGTDADVVKNATTASPEYIGPRALGAESHDPGGLAWDSSYAWRVDEVYPTETIKGLVWSFTTADFIGVDDFESYNDIDPPDPASNTIYSNWIDGYGVPTNGAITANDLPPYAEQTTVHRGAQSMKFLYDTNLMISESTLTLVYPKDWTAEGVTKLILWFRGNSGNAAERMFVALNGTGVVYHDDPAASQITGWNQWVIELQRFADQGVDLTNVRSITIGFGTKNSPAAGGSGEVYFDDIGLYR